MFLCGGSPAYPRRLRAEMKGLIKMRTSNLARKHTGEKETVDSCLDRVMETIVQELEKGSPDDLKKLIRRRKRQLRKKNKGIPQNSTGSGMQ